LSTEEKFKRKIQKLKEKRKKDKRKHEEDLRILKEDSRILKKGHEDLISKIQEMRKEGCSEVNHSKTSPSEIM
jgi:phage/plasmid-associated DNA primase